MTGAEMLVTEKIDPEIEFMVAAGAPAWRRAWLCPHDGRFR
jgi:hypothetical protein